MQAVLRVCVQLIFVRGGPVCVFKPCWDDWREMEGEDKEERASNWLKWTRLSSEKWVNDIFL